MYAKCFATYKILIRVHASIFNHAPAKICISSSRLTGDFGILCLMLLFWADLLPLSVKILPCSQKSHVHKYSYAPVHLKSALGSKFLFSKEGCTQPRSWGNSFSKQKSRIRATGIRTVLSDGTKTELSDAKRISLWASRLVILEAVSNWSAEGKSMLLEEVITWRSPSLVKNTSGWGHLLCDSLMGHWSESFQTLNCLPCHLNCRVFWQALQLQSQSFVREHASD